MIQILYLINELNAADEYEIFGIRLNNFRLQKWLRFNSWMCWNLYKVYKVNMTAWY